MERRERRENVSSDFEKKTQGEKDENKRFLEMVRLYYENRKPFDMSSSMVNHELEVKFGTKASIAALACSSKVAALFLKKIIVPSWCRTSS
jgi:hypothetical protein